MNEQCLQKIWKNTFLFNTVHIKHFNMFSPWSYLRLSPIWRLINFFLTYWIFRYASEWFIMILSNSFWKFVVYITTFVFIAPCSISRLLLDWKKICKTHDFRNQALIDYPFAFFLPFKVILQEIWYHSQKHNTFQIHFQTQDTLYYLDYCAIFLLFWKSVRLLRHIKNKHQNLSKQEKLCGKSANNMS